MRRLKLYYLFFLSTLKINILFSILASIIITKGDWQIIFLPLPKMLGGLGILVSLLYKEIFAKQAYYFYYNAGISKRLLIIITLAVYWIIIGIIKLCITHLK